MKFTLADILILRDSFDKIREVTCTMELRGLEVTGEEVTGQEIFDFDVAIVSAMGKLEEILAKMGDAQAIENRDHPPF